jgi:hypothetical protein
MKLGDDAREGVAMMDGDDLRLEYNALANKVGLQQPQRQPGDRLPCGT